MSGFGQINGIKKKKENPEEDDTNKYYVGGADGHGGGSGLAVMAPPPKKKEGEAEDVYQRMIEAAKKDAKEKPLASHEQVLTITLYRNGFTVGDGPLRERGVPLNDQFLDELSRGVCPRELLRNGQPQDVKLVDKSKEDFNAPAYTAFSGAGQAIGSSALQVDPNAIINHDGNDTLPDVNEAEKTIRVQVKYSDGTKQVLKFNLFHTVNHLIAVIRESGKVKSPFVLQDAKKNVLLGSVFSSSLTEAGVANSVVMVITRI